ncbi:MAG: hypothetical protein CVT95_06040, partial [Bacteroidetes bacterium HGW-Bacteroidetes-12]
MSAFSLFKSILIVVSVFFTSIAFSQDDTYVYGDVGVTKNKTQPQGFSWDKVTIGGNFGATFGDIVYVELSPQIGYYLTENIVVGVGGNYVYYEEKRINFSTSIYGGRVFGQYIFSELPFLAHVEGELINVPDFNNTRLNIYNFYVGGGLKQQFGNNSY